MRYLQQCPWRREILRDSAKIKGDDRLGWRWVPVV